MALVIRPEEEEKGPSPVMQVAALVAVTALAVGMGWYAGGYLEGRHTPEFKPGTIKDFPGTAAETAGAEGEAPVAPAIVPLEPITTNLADPGDVWVRLELAIVFDGTPDGALAAAVHQDLFAYMRTVRLRQVDSASGFRHLKDELRERARLRSEGRVSDILITTFLYE